MSQIASDWMELLTALPREDRAEIAQRLLGSLDEPTDPDWESAWADELKKRAERMKNGSVKGIPFEEVMATIRRKIA
jgi:putative addiction module component (TIGR02574 family)